MQIPLLTASYTGKSTNIEASRCVNFYPEIPSSPFAKCPISLIGTPGTEVYLDYGFPVLPPRMLHVFGGLLFTVIGDDCFVSDVNKTVSVSLFKLATTTGRLSVKDNGITANGVGGNQMLIVDGVYGYLYNINTNTMVRSDAFTGANSTGITAFPANPQQVTYIDGYFVVTNETMNGYVSDLYDGSSWGGLASFGAVAASDIIQTVFALQQQLYVIKEYTTELFADAGVATTVGCPFARQAGAVFDYGTMAPWSIARGGGSLFMLANIRSGDVAEFAGVVALSGYTASIISTSDITTRMSKFYMYDAFGYCYSDEGHTFYVLTFPTDNATFIYDQMTQMWHERSSYIDGDMYQVNRHLGNHYVKYAEKHIIADYASSKILSMSSAIYEDVAQPIVSFFISPYITDKQEYENVAISRLVVDAETGVGRDVYITNTSNLCLANGTCYADGTHYAGSPVITTLDTDTADPQLVLDWSKDGGHTWSNKHPKSLGRVGEYLSGLVWRALGMSKQRIFRLTCSSKVKKIIINGYVEAGK